jgi:hypothetical protein
MMTVLVTFSHAATTKAFACEGPVQLNLAPIRMFDGDFVLAGRCVR